MAEPHLGPYILEQPLARGGMGDVWRARREGPAGYVHRVAIKRIHPHLVGDPHTVQLFLREARIGSRLRHPNSVPVIDLDIVDDCPYLVMELVDGVDLRRLMRRGELAADPIPPALAGYVVHQVLWALEAAHNLTDASGQPTPLIHRDISPENILVGRYGDVRVADFGLAKPLLGGSALTRAGEIKGKYPYMSPEQLRGQALDGRSDLYSLGICFFELLCGRRPYAASGPVAALEGSYGQRPHPCDLRPSLPLTLADLAFRWCQPDPKQRGADVVEARRELSAVLDLMITGMANVQLVRWMARSSPAQVQGLATQLPSTQVFALACAKCGGELHNHRVRGDVLADICEDCQGVWLDAHELRRILGQSADVGDELLHEASALDEVRGDCPRCSCTLDAHAVTRGARRFHVEQCPRCLGIWFDHGELESFVGGGVAAAVRDIGGLILPL